MIRHAGSVSITSVLRLRAEAARPSALVTLVDRVQALERFVVAARPYLPAARLEAADAVLALAGARLVLSREHTVVALAGATGSGRSSIFNMITTLDLSTVGHLRPTTSRTHACVWGHGNANPLLDWLGVDARAMVDDEEAVHGGQRSLRGLVLLDLPDFDSIEANHRREVDRLVALADLVVWVLDPQKYADRVLHRQYLNRFRHHNDITAVVLNQADRLRPSDVERCLADLRRLLADDGLGDVPLFATSTVGKPGLRPLRLLLERTVAARTAALRHVSADLDAVVADLAPLMVAEPAAVSSDGLADALAAAAGVPAIVAGRTAAYSRAAIRGMTWPAVRPPARGPEVDSPEWMPAAVDQSVQSFAERAGGDLAAPWRAAVVWAARAGQDSLAGEVRDALGRTAPRAVPWRVVGVIELLLAGTVVGGLVRLALAPDRRGPGGAFVIAAAVAGLVVVAAARLAIALRVGRLRRAMDRRLRAAVDQVAEARVVEPVRTVLRAYAEARAALALAADRRE